MDDQLNYFIRAVAVETVTTSDTKGCDTVPHGVLLSWLTHIINLPEQSDLCDNMPVRSYNYTSVLPDPIFNKAAGRITEQVTKYVEHCSIYYWEGGT